ncbi:HipA domain-containing protein [Microbulbifer sp.]|uniref:type II toxin-antitoxin system HipA family toxin n=1 Tax=Microbulbifer sp. TaxID=1908541 RepID=UPI00258E6FA3|nr:HipA domain-containing protein [Microbulbifer sp.]
MFPEQATIEVYRSGRWQPAGILCPLKPQLGYCGPSRLEYALEYAAEYAGPDTTRAAGLSCRYPVDFTQHEAPHWPAFVLDMLPNGFGRQQWLELLKLRDTASADWPLLLRGAAFPPGNLRIAEAVAAKDLSTPVPTANGALVPMADHPGFNLEDVLNRREHFVEYAFQHGIYAAGASDVQGIAPKLLLVQDLEGRWHAEGVLPDDRVSAFWILKRPRGRAAADRNILRNEAAYMRVAREMGLRVFAELEWDNDSLFIPRFDRRVQKGKSVDRLGMESLCSLAGVAEFGKPISHDTLCRALIRYSSQPGADLLEYIQRDILNLALGNKDNHARNTAVYRFENGDVTLTPLFDFAPMYLDPEGIARVCRWEGDAETAGRPEWGKVLERYREQLPDGAARLRTFGTRLRQLPDIAHKAGVDGNIIEHQLPAISANADQLESLSDAQ